MYCKCLDVYLPLFCSMLTMWRRWTHQTHFNTPTKAFEIGWIWKGSLVSRCSTRWVSQDFQRISKRSNADQPCWALLSIEHHSMGSRRCKCLEFLQGMMHPEVSCSNMWWWNSFVLQPFPICSARCLCSANQFKNTGLDDLCLHNVSFAYSKCLRT